MAPNEPAVLPGLESLGAKTEDDAKAAGVQLVPQPARDLTDAKAWKAIDHLPEGTTVDSIRRDAKKLADNADLNTLSFLNLIKKYDVSATPAVDDMLSEIKARNAGEAGKRVVMITTRTSEFGGQAPKIDPHFVEKYKAGLAKGKDVIHMIEWISERLQRYANSFRSLESLVDQEVQYHLAQSQKSVEATARDLVISRQEQDREDALTKVTALLEALQEELALRLNGPAKLSEEDTTRLQNVSVLVVARIKNLRPMIEDANAAVKRFALQSNSNALTALDQYDFATAGLAAWKRNIAGEIDSKANIIMNLAYLKAQQFTREQEEATVAAFDAQMQSMAEILDTQLGSLEMIQKMTDSLVNAGHTMATALEKAQDESNEAAKVIGVCRDKVAASEQELSKETARILGK